MATLNAYAPSFVPVGGDRAQVVSLSPIYYSYPISEVLPSWQPSSSMLLPPCRPSLVDPAGLPMPATTIVPAPAPELPPLCYAAGGYYGSLYDHGLGVKMGFPCPWSTQTFVGVAAAPFHDLPTEIGLRFYPAFPIQQKELLPLPAAPAWHLPPHRPVQPEIVELPPTPPKKTHRPAAVLKSPRRPDHLGKRVKVCPRFKTAAADVSATEAAGELGPVTRWTPWRSGHHGGQVKNSWVPRLRRYWQKASPGENSYEKFQFKSPRGDVPEENSTSGLAGDVEDGPAGDARTTVMIKNIPNKLTREAMLSYLCRHCREENCKLEATICGHDERRANTIPSRFDFFYLPMDFRTGSNLGYAFVNFTSAVAAWRLYRAFDKMPWSCMGSKKVCEVTYARIQGLDPLVKHFRNSSFSCDRDELLPVYFLPYCDGTVEGRSHRVGRRVPTTSSNYCWRRR